MDVYAMGVVLYLIFLGRTPFREASDHLLIARIRHEEPPRPRDLDPDLPPSLERLLLRALQKAPGDRFSTMEQMAIALEQELVQTGHPPTTEQLGQFVAKVLPPNRTRPFQGTARRRRPAFPTPPREEVLQIVATERDAVPRFAKARTAELDDLPTTRYGGELLKAALGRADEPLTGKSTDEMPHPPKHIASEDPTDKVEPADLPTSPLPSHDDEDPV